MSANQIVHSLQSTSNNSRGTSENYKTTEANEKSNRLSIKLADLPRSIADAVELCRELNIYHLWVDALCIIQDHDSIEWHEEASKIDKIYGFAFFTLALSSSADCNDGFRATERGRSTRQDATRATLAHHLIQAAPKTLQETRKQSALGRRGWAFQEERLSGRIVHWTAHGVYWTCLSGYVSEHVQSFTSATAGEPSPFYTDFVSRYHQDHEHENDGTFDTLWTRLIEQYSTRLFTRIEDRLPALSGLANKFAAVFEDQYIAGHWQNSLQSQLLWVTAHRTWMSDDKVSMKTLDIAPYWSWVSVPPSAGVIFPRRYGRRAFEYKSHDVGYRSGDRFGAILRASLKLQARMRPLLEGETRIDWPNFEIHDEFDRPMFPRVKDVVYALDSATGRILLSYNAAHPILIETDYGIPRALDRCYCLEINTSGFLLLEQIEQSEQYRRIGCASWHEDKSFFESRTATVVELI